MSALAKLGFETQAARDFVWPYPKPLAEVTDEPPYETKPRNYYLPRSPPEECSCYEHACEANTYRGLLGKKNILEQKIEVLNQQMTAITNDLMDTPCGITDEAMKAVYEADFAKRGWPFTTYRKLMAETDCEMCPPPVFKQELGLRNGYRDPRSFRLFPHALPGIDPAKPITFDSTPESFTYYRKEWPGRTEYMDNYSKVAVATLRASQQYREPLPSTRRRTS